MEREQDIEQIFKKAFEHYQPAVDPGVWTGVKAGLTAAKAGATAGSAILGKIGLAAIIAGAVALVTVQEVQLHKAQDQQHESAPAPVEQVQADQVKTPEDVAKTSQTGSETGTVASAETKKEKSHSFPPEVEKAFEEHAKSNTRTNSSENAGEASGAGLKKAPAVGANTKPGTASNQNTPQAEKGKPATPAKKVAEEQAAVPLEAALSANPQGGPTPLDVHLSIQANKEIARIDWDFGDGNRIAGNKSLHYTYGFPGDYLITANITDREGTVVTLTEWIKVKGEDHADKPKSELQLPEDAGSGFVLTPNGDGINDEFSLVAVAHISEFRVSIFSQGGGLVYESHDPSFQWNGRDRGGKIVPNGTYYIQITALGMDEQPFEFKKFITVR